ncbi:MAG: polysaccharide deacetylase family protein [Blautia sp.]|uniref:polysaccharide deacetylase family protein n=1 Tax=Blautia TaxID=572511 RepID=UPI000BA3C1F8|nr:MULTISPECIES: polysaccharide deacetylase family protein [Blautia]MDR3894687.1 polysaccharide deacetylase family protein [Blautia sp.]
MMEDERDLEYERRRQERMRRRRLEKKRQMRRRRIMRLVAMAAVLVLVIGLVGTGIHKLISGKTGVPKEGAVEVKAQTTSQEDTSAATKQPVMGAADLAKMASAGVMGWQQDDKGWWYRDTDGTFFKGGWKEIEGSRYYFDENGYMKTGWLELDGEDYFFDDSGKYDETKKRPMVALTFDDGPGEHTEELLDCLTKNNAKATFFMLGSNAAAFPDVVKDLKDAGMELGNHTYDHLDLTTLDSESVTSQIKRTNDAISGAAGVPATVMRPPGGAYNESVQAAVGMPVIMWSIDTKDWLTKSEDQTYQVTVDNVKDGSIVLMHDIHEWSVKAAIRVIPELVEQGYKLVTVSELAEAKGIKLENGAAHYFFGEGEQQVE